MNNEDEDVYVPPTYEELILEMKDFIYQETPAYEELVAELEKPFVPKDIYLRKLDLLAKFVTSNHHQNGRLSYSKFPELSTMIRNIGTWDECLDHLQKSFEASIVKTHSGANAGFKLISKTKNKMQELIQKVNEFNSTAGQPVNTELTLISEERKSLKLGLIKEEMEEL